MTLGRGKRKRSMNEREYMWIVYRKTCREYTTAKCMEKHTIIKHNSALHRLKQERYEILTQV